MPLESGSVIEDLDSLWPLGGDPILQGDDHIRLLKSILKQQFPGSGGLGFSKTITATEDEINYLSGVTSNIQDQIDLIVSDTGLSAPSGTVMIFANAAPPLGWTKKTNADNGLLHHITDGTGGNTGGSDAVLTAFDHNHSTSGHVLTEAEMPSHSHTVIQNWSDTGHQLEDGDGHNHFFTVSDQVTTFAGGDGSHTHGSTGTENFSPKYLNVISAEKD